MKSGRVTKLPTMVRPASLRTGPWLFSRPEIWPTGYAARSARTRRRRAGSNEESAYWPLWLPRASSTPRTSALGFALAPRFSSISSGILPPTRSSTCASVGTC